MKQTWKPIAAGILSIVSGASGVVIGLVIALVGGSAAWYAGVPFFVPRMMALIGAPMVVLGVVAVVGGIYAVRRELWGLALAGAICALLILVMSQPWSNGLSLCSGVLLGVAVAALWPTTLAYTAHRFPAGGASMFSLLAAAGNAGGAAFPWAIGVIAEHSNLHWGLGAAAMLPVVLVAVFAAVQARPKTDE